MLIILGCGESLPDKDFGRECEVYNDMYSHTILFCGGRGVDNVEDVFQVCNYQRQASEQVDDCVSNFDLCPQTSDCSLFIVTGPLELLRNVIIFISFSVS